MFGRKQSKKKWCTQKKNKQIWNTIAHVSTDHPCDSENLRRLVCRSRAAGSDGQYPRDGSRTGRVLHDGRWKCGRGYRFVSFLLAVRSNFRDWNFVVSSPPFCPHRFPCASTPIAGQSLCVFNDEVYKAVLCADSWSRVSFICDCVRWHEQVILPEIAQQQRRLFVQLLLHAKNAHWSFEGWMDVTFTWKKKWRRNVSSFRC